MVPDEVHKEHQHQDATESDHDGGASGRIENHTEITAERGDERAHGPADGEARANAVREKHGANAGNDQVTEDQQHTGDGHGRRHNKTKRSVEEEVPEADVEARLFGLTVVHGDGQKSLAKKKMKAAETAVEDSVFATFPRGNSGANCREAGLGVA